MTLQPRYQLSASLVCANMLDVGTDIRSAEQGGIDSIHFDVMDSHFVQRLGLHPEMLLAARSITSLPIDVHLMMSDPEPYIPLFVENGASVITVHAEATPHLHRVVRQIKKLGAKAGVALNPGTSLSVLDYVVDDIDWVLLMAINPGIVGHPLIPNAFKKIRKLKEMLKDRPDVVIEIDGGVTFDSAAQMVDAGATMLVCGSSTIFKPSEKIEDKIAQLRSRIDRDLA